MKSLNLIYPWGESTVHPFYIYTIAKKNDLHSIVSTKMTVYAVNICCWQTRCLTTSLNEAIVCLKRWTKIQKKRINIKNWMNNIWKTESKKHLKQVCACVRWKTLIKCLKNHYLKHWLWEAGFKHSHIWYFRYR